MNKVESIKFCQQCEEPMKRCGWAFHSSLDDYAILHQCLKCGQIYEFFDDINVNA